MRNDTKFVAVEGREVKNEGAAVGGSAGPSAQARNAWMWWSRHRGIGVVRAALVALALAAAHANAQSFNVGGGLGGFVAIPDGGPGCNALGGPILRYRVTVPGPLGPIAPGSLQITLTFSHPRAGDLRVTLTHGGRQSTLLAPLCTATQSANAGYIFRDGAAVLLLAGANANATVPGNSYLPVTPLSVFDGCSPVGDWELSIEDVASGPSAGSSSLTPTVAAFSVYGVATAGPSFGAWQPAPGGVGSSVWVPTAGGPTAPTIQVCNVGLTAGQVYVNAMTLFPGAYPTGWFGGVDIDLFSLAGQVSSGMPLFVGTAASSAAIVQSIPTPPSLVGMSLYVGTVVLGTGNIPTVSPQPTMFTIR